ncbi:hypothetical protein BC936DRAFT_149373 [Jimgerdemannia flammicorona]|uniref:Uncharacterized protein n=1 Tax=Jimgerdemannia flammicorona TaxID=994334 RepID=A0A433D0Y6_9FUNG|nr:hypothetical protein BC936DRAFT_149373 [Jimgerdemannia flammicorona]
MDVGGEDRTLGLAGRMADGVKEVRFARGVDGESRERNLFPKLEGEVEVLGSRAIGLVVSGGYLASQGGVQFWSLTQRLRINQLHDIHIRLHHDHQLIVSHFLRQREVGRDCDIDGFATGVFIVHLPRLLRIGHETSGLAGVLAEHNDGVVATLDAALHSARRVPRVVTDRVAGTQELKAMHLREAVEGVHNVVCLTVGEGDVEDALA